MLPLAPNEGFEIDIWSVREFAVKDGQAIWGITTRQTKSQDKILCPRLYLASCDDSAGRSVKHC